MTQPSLWEEQLEFKVREVLSMDLPLTLREIHVVALAAFELQARNVDVWKEPVVIQVDAWRHLTLSVWLLRPRGAV